MIKKLKEGPEEFKDYDSELLLKILNKTSLENEKGDDKELFVDENWKINSKNMKILIEKACGPPFDLKLPNFYPDCV